MSQDSHNALQHAVLKLLKPLVRLLLRHGIAHKAFCELAKRAYVEVAARDFQVGRRKMSDSRIATLTGLTRKEVARIRNLPPSDDGIDIQRYHRAARVVWGWVHDPRFQDEQGHPLPLPLEGEPSFTSLVRAHSGDIPVRAILDELLAVGVVVREGELLRLTAPAYIPRAGEAEKLHILGTDVAGLIDTIDRNIHGEAKPPLFQRKVYYDNLPEEFIPILRAILVREGQTFLERLDREMAAHDRDVNPDAGGSGRRAAGIGLYYFEDEPPNTPETGDKGDPTP